jgi:hypothetical protein
MPNLLPAEPVLSSYRMILNVMDTGAEGPVPFADLIRIA